MSQPKDIKLLIRNSQLISKAIREGKPKDYYIRLEAESQSKSSNPTQTTAPAEIKLNLSPVAKATLEAGLDSNSPAIPKIQLNAQQQAAVDLALSGKSFVLIGPAGSGKTFTVNYILQSLIENHKLPRMSVETKNLVKGDYGFMACAYTRRATSVVRKNLPPGLKACTIHSLLEYRPEKTVVENEDGSLRNSMIFVPGRHRANPLPANLSLIALDEASMISTELHQEIIDATPHRPQMIYIGDLAQLKPVFGDAILGYKLNELPVVELTEIYRQKDGEILDFATEIRKGTNLTNFTTPEYKNPRLLISQFKTSEREQVRLAQFGHLLEKAIDSKEIDPLAGDLILCPQNVGIGNIELNKHVGDYYDRKFNRKLYPIIAGFKTVFYAIGDKILIDRNDAIITDIKPNLKYVGRLPGLPSNSINRWGSIRTQEYFEGESSDSSDLPNESESDPDEFEASLAQLAGQSLEDIDDSDSRTNEASHVIHYQFINPDLQTQLKYEASLDKSNDEFISSAGDINKLELAYCISVHKSQGSQADHVMILLAKQHGRMLSRELLYTAVTRAAKKLTIYADVGCISKAISSPSIKGNTIAEKAEFFKGREERKLKEKQ